MRAGLLVEPSARGVVPRHMVLSVATTRAREDLTFGDYFEQLMLQSFANREQLARASGIDATTIGRWIRGTKEPTIGNLRSVAPHLGVRLGDLIVRAGLATREELGMIGAPPPPGPPLAPVLRSAQSRLLGPKLTARRKRALEAHLERALLMFDDMVEEIDNGPREPRMR